MPVGERVNRKTVVGFHGVLIDQFIALFKTPPTELLLDFDATDDRVHGKQEGRFFHGYYGDWCFLPLYVFCGERLLVSDLRWCEHHGVGYIVDLISS